MLAEKTSEAEGIVRFNCINGAWSGQYDRKLGTVSVHGAPGGDFTAPAGSLVWQSDTLPAPDRDYNANIIEIERQIASGQ